MAISYFFFFGFNLKKENVTYSKIFFNWLWHSAVFTITYLLAHIVSITIFQMVNYRWYSDMVGAELIFIFPAIVSMNILILITRIIKKSVNDQTSKNKK